MSEKADDKATDETATTGDETGNVATEAAKVEAPEQPKVDVRPPKKVTQIDAKQEIKPVVPSRMKAGDFAFTHWRVMVYPGTEQSALENEQFWAFVSKDMRAGDLVSALTDDMTTCFDGIVIAAGDKWAEVQITKVTELKRAGRDIGKQDYKAEWGGPSHLYRVKRGDEVMVHGLETMKEAQAWIKGRIVNKL